MNVNYDSEEDEELKDYVQQKKQERYDKRALSSSSTDEDALRMERLLKERANENA